MERDRLGISDGISLHFLTYGVFPADFLVLGGGTAGPMDVSFDSNDAKHLNSQVFLIPKPPLCIRLFRPPINWACPAQQDSVFV